MDDTKKYLKMTKYAGLLFFIAGIIIFMGIITAEIYYPSGYSTRENEISDLGATKPPNSIITQPSSTIFNTTMIVTGIMILLAAIIMYYNYEKIISIPIIILGIGVLGVGLFPGNITPWHPIFALLTFISGAISAIISFKIVRFPLNYIFLSLGSISLLFLLLNQVFASYLGFGGAERFVAYPVVFWLMGLGSYLIGINNEYNY